MMEDFHWEGKEKGASPSDEQLAALGRTRDELRQIYSERPSCIHAYLNSLTDDEYAELMRKAQTL